MVTYQDRQGSSQGSYAGWSWVYALLTPFEVITDPLYLIDLGLGIHLHSEADHISTQHVRNLVVAYLR